MLKEVKALGWHIIRNDTNRSDKQKSQSQKRCNILMDSREHHLPERNMLGNIHVAEHCLAGKNATCHVAMVIHCHSGGVPQPKQTHHNKCR